MLDWKLHLLACAGHLVFQSSTKKIGNGSKGVICIPNALFINNMEFLHLTTSFQAHHFIQLESTEDRPLAMTSNDKACVPYFLAYVEYRTPPPASSSP